MRPTRVVAGVILAVAAMLRGATARGLNVPRRAWWERSRGGGGPTIRARQRQWNRWACGMAMFPPGWGESATARPGGPVPRRDRRRNVARKRARKAAAKVLRRLGISLEEFRWRRAADGSATA